MTLPTPPIDADICDVYAHGSGGVRLTGTPPGVELPACDHALPALVTVVTTLAPVVQPLALASRADIYELDFPFGISTAVPFPAPSVLLRQAHLPPALAIQLTGWEPAAVTEVPAVTAAAVQAWAAAGGGAVACPRSQRGRGPEWGMVSARPRPRVS